MAPVKRFAALSVTENYPGSFEGTVFERKNKKKHLKYHVSLFFLDFMNFRKIFLILSKMAPSKEA